MRLLAILWLCGWAFIGFPWRSFRTTPNFENVHLVPFRDGRPFAVIANVVVFVPWGGIGVGLGWRSSQALLSGAAVSGTTELLQLFSRGRHPSSTDLILNLSGTAVGVALAQSLRRMAASRRS